MSNFPVLTKNGRALPVYSWVSLTVGGVTANTPWKTNNTHKSVNKTTVFFTGTKEQEICVWNEFVLSIEKATEIAIEFFLKHDLPKCVKWSEE